MKKIILLMFAIGMFINANAQKMATVNSNELVLSMPETKTMQKQLEGKQEELKKQMEVMYKQYEAKANELKGMENKAMDAINKAKVEELQDLQKRIEKFEVEANKEVQGLEQKLSLPILEKAKKSIEEVAKEKGYTHVFDVSGGGLIVFPTGDDITDAIKAKLGIPATAPAAPAGKK